MTRMSFAGMILLCGIAPAAAAHQDWVVTHQTDRVMDRTMMQAWADADTGRARMALYCDTENGFRVMFMPNRALMPEGPSWVTLTIDDASPLILKGDAFGDNATDVVITRNSGQIQRALSTAHHVRVHFDNGNGKTGDDAFTFGDLAVQRETLMKVCPVSR